LIVGFYLTNNRVRSKIYFNEISFTLF